MKYQITIREIKETEVPETEYKKLGTKDKIGKDEWGFVKTGKTTILKSENVVYEQEITDLDIRELAIYINRAK